PQVRQDLRPAEEARGGSPGRPGGLPRIHHRRPLRRRIRPRLRRVLPQPPVHRDPGTRRREMTMKFLATDGAPKAIGPYSQAVIEGGFLFASGQIPLDPATGELVGGGIEKATSRVLDNMEAVLKTAGLTFADVVKTTVFLVKAEDFPAMNGVYAARFGD